MPMEGKPEKNDVIKSLEKEAQLAHSRKNYLAHNAELAMWANSNALTSESTLRQVVEGDAQVENLFRKIVTERQIPIAKDDLDTIISVTKIGDGDVYFLKTTMADYQIDPQGEGIYVTYDGKLRQSLPQHEERGFLKRFPLEELSDARTEAVNQYIAELEQRVAKTMQLIKDAEKKHRDS